MKGVWEEAQGGSFSFTESFRFSSSSQIGRHDHRKKIDRKQTEKQINKQECIPVDAYCQSSSRPQGAGGLPQCMLGYTPPGVGLETPRCGPCNNT